MRARYLLTAAGIVAIAAALVVFASLPTGAATRDEVVPSDARIAASRPVGDVRVLLLSQRGRLRLLVAYHRSKGWFAVRVAPAPQGSPVAWAATRGSHSIPPLSAVYGRVDGTRARVRWTDGREADAGLGGDGSYLAVRRGRVRVGGVVVTASDGTTTTLAGP